MKDAAMKKVVMEDVEKRKRAAGSPTPASPETSAPARPKVPYTRRFPRFSLDVRIGVKMFQEGEYRSCWGRSTEIGQDGIGATLTGNLTAGEIVTLEIPLPLSTYPVKVRAIVRYTQGLRYGFEFLTLNGHQRDTLQRVCAYLATKS